MLVPFSVVPSPRFSYSLYAYVFAWANWLSSLCCAYFASQHRVCAVILSWFPSRFAHVYLFCQCASPRKHLVCAVLLSSVPFPFCTRLFVLSVCFASQTPGLCCAVSSLPYKFVRFCALFVLYNRFCVAHFALQASGLLGPKPKFLFGFVVF